MKLSDLEIFCAVLEEGSITAAARRLHRVQSNITTRIKQLEKKLGVSLFIREGKRLHVSPSGIVLAEYAGRLLDLAQEAKQAVTSQTPQGVFRLGAMESTAIVRLPAPITAYHRAHPQVEIELKTGNPRQLSTALLNGRIDAALMAGPVAQKSFDTLVAFSEETVLVTSTDHAPIKSHGPLPKTVIVFEDGCPHRKLLEHCYALREETPARTIELGSYHAMLSCVIAGMGAALLPGSILDTFSQAELLKVHRLPKRINTLTTLLVWRKGFDSPNLQALKVILGRSSRGCGTKPDIKH